MDKPCSSDKDFIQQLINCIRDVITSTVSGKLMQAIPEKANVAYNRLSAEKKLRMLIGLDAAIPICRNIFTKHFTCLSAVMEKDKQQLNRYIRNLIYECKPWDVDWLSLISHINCQSQMVIGLQELIREATERIKLNLADTVPFTAFYVFGCPTSTDIDVAVVVEMEEYLQRQIDQDSLKQQLKNLDYDITREIDVNLILLSHNGNIVNVYKGNVRETQNIIYRTYQYHRQAHPCAIQREMAIDITDKIKAAVKFVLDYMEDLIGPEEYLVERDRRRAAYKSLDRLPFALHLLEKIQRFDTLEWRSAIKSLTMKIIQLILLERNETEYTKPGLAAKFDAIHPGTGPNVAWLLNRGRIGTYDADCLQLLLSEFARIICPKQREISWRPLPINLTINPTDLPDDLIREFLRSPLKPTDSFVSSFSEICLTRNINPLFLIHCVNAHRLPPSVLIKSVLVAQRTPQWIRLLNHYSCGRNTGLIAYDGPDWVSFYYNLIRGSIIELFVMRGGDFSGLVADAVPVTLGMLVKDRDVAGSIAIAPDLLLVRPNGETIPVEIKCIPCAPSQNHDYRRAIKLAKCQIQTSLDIINGTVRRGIIVLVYIYERDNLCIIEAHAGFVEI